MDRPRLGWLPGSLLAAESVDLCQFCSTKLLYIPRLHGLVRTDTLGLLMFASLTRCVDLQAEGGFRYMDINIVTSRVTAMLEVTCKGARV